MDYCETTVSSTAQPLYPLGSTEVTWAAVDSSGNYGSDTQDVLMVDTTGPALEAPRDIVAECQSPQGTTGPIQS